MTNKFTYATELEKLEAEDAARNAKINSYEQQLKAWKAERRATSRKKARVIEKLEQQRETERLVAQGELADKIFSWMRNTTVNNGNENITLWEWWEQTQCMQNREHGDIG